MQQPFFYISKKRILGIKAALSKPYARFVKKRIENWSKNAVDRQEKTMHYLIRKAKNTSYGIDHDFDKVKSYDDFKAHVPICDYEGLVQYIDKIKEGEVNVLWPGKPLYLCKTSGTTSGAKYIPLTRASLPNHIGTARNALLSYIADTGNSNFVNGKMIFLQGSPLLEHFDSGIYFGRLSGIVANHVPSYLIKNRMPTYKTNCIEDWEEKVNKIVEETKNEDMTLISGIPSWVQMYYEKLLEKTGKKNISELFKNLSLFVYGGVNFDPYKSTFKKLIGKDIPSVELYPASEGFIAFQDSQKDEGMLLVVNSGIFFEFIPLVEYHKSPDARISLKDVKIDVNYVLIINSNAGLWGYNLGDTIKFVSIDPPRIKVTGRIKHYTSAFGEHVIAEEVEKAMKFLLDQNEVLIHEFHVAPEVNPESGLPYHEWFVEMDELPSNLNEIAEILNNQMQSYNIYYRDLIEGKVLQSLKIVPLKKGAFNQYMKSVGKLGGQNKVPRLSNDRIIADMLVDMKL